MEPYGSLSYTHEPPNRSHLASKESSPRPSHPFYLRFILMLSSHLRLGILNGLVPAGIPTKIFYAFLMSHFKPRGKSPWCLLDRKLGVTQSPSGRGHEKEILIPAPAGHRTPIAQT
jgi:hypothetical protein